VALRLEQRGVEDARAQRGGGGRLDAEQAFARVRLGQGELALRSGTPRGAACRSPGSESTKKRRR
jgi:hypothetical protein